MPEEVRQLLGFAAAGYKQIFVKDVSQITKPLTKLMPPSINERSRNQKTLFGTLEIKGKNIQHCLKSAYSATHTGLP